MTLKQRIAHWKETPNGAGSAAQLAVLVAEAAIASGKPVPQHIEHALKVLALRTTLHDMTSSHRDENNNNFAPASAQFHCLDALAITLLASPVSWTEAITTILLYLEAHAGEQASAS